MKAHATTSAALATSPARGGIAVIVLTGPETERIVREIFRAKGRRPQSGHLALGQIVDDDEVLDEAIVSCPSDGVAEINIHGGLHVARKVLSLLAERGARIVSDCPADPVLSEIRMPGPKNSAIMEEFLSALRMVSTPLGASAVSCQWSGGLSVLAASSRPDPACLRAAADALPLMHRLLEPAEVVIAGPPNVGKSALANALVGRNVAIVSETPGTTRDWVATLTDTDGVPIRLTDTAGLWEQATGIDAEAVRRAWERIESADLIICVTAGADGEFTELVAHLRALPNVINVAGKCDLDERGWHGQVEAKRKLGRGERVTEDNTANLHSVPLDRATHQITYGETLAVSAETLAGIDALRRAIRDDLGFADFNPTAAMAFTARQADHLRTAAESLDRSNQTGARSALGELLKTDG